MIKVLSMRGGGIRGYATAILLADLERRIGKPLCEVFELVAGTSVGGILATGIAIKIPAAGLVRFFEDEGPFIFKPRWFAPMLRSLGKPRFEVDNLRKALERHFLPETLLAHTFVKLMVTSTRYRGLQSQVWKSWKHPDMSAVDVAASSAAALTYFDAVEISGFKFGDGGMWANNPAPAAAIEARKLWRSHQIVIVDIACPDDKSQFEPKGGLLEAAPHVASIFIGAGEDGMSHLAKEFLHGNGEVLSIEPELLDANRDIGDASQRNLTELRRAAEYRLERNVDAIIALLGKPAAKW